MPCHGGGCGCSFLPSAAHPITGAAHGPRCASSSSLPSNIWRSPGSLKTHLPTCRLWYTQHLQIPVQKTGKPPQIPQRLSRGPRHRLLCSCCSERLDARLHLGAVGHLRRQLSVPLQGSVGSQRQGVSANHQVQLISSLRNQGNSQTAVKVSRSDAVYLPGWI